MRGSSISSAATPAHWSVVMLRTQLPLVCMPCRPTLRELRHRVRQVLELDPVELDVLPRGEMAVAAVIARVRHGRACAAGPTTACRRGSRSAQHVGMKLQVDAVHQPQRLELLLGQFARQPPPRPDRGIPPRARRPGCDRNRHRGTCQAPPAGSRGASATAGSAMVGAVEPDPLAQIGGLQPALGVKAHRGDISTDRAGIVGDGAGKKRRRRRRIVDHRGLRQRRRPVAVESAVDHGAVAQPVGGDDDGTGDPELLLQRGRHAAISWRCAARTASHGSECATTSPTTMRAGPSPTSRGQCLERGQGAGDARGIGAGAARQHRDRRVRIAAGRDQSVAHRRGGGEAHVDDDSRCGVAQSGPVGPPRHPRRVAR